MLVGVSMLSSIKDPFPTSEAKDKHKYTVRSTSLHTHIHVKLDTHKPHAPTGEHGTSEHVKKTF